MLSKCFFIQGDETSANGFKLLNTQDATELGGNTAALKTPGGALASAQPGADALYLTAGKYGGQIHIATALGNRTAPTVHLVNVEIRRMGQFGRKDRHALYWEDMVGRGWGLAASGWKSVMISAPLPHVSRLPSRLGARLTIPLPPCRRATTCPATGTWSRAPRCGRSTTALWCSRTPAASRCAGRAGAGQGHRWCRLIHWRRGLAQVGRNRAQRPTIVSLDRSRTTLLLTWPATPLP